MSTLSEPNRCPKCGGPIPAEAPQGLCPTCLFQQVCVPTEAGRKGESAKSPPPKQEELAAAFPQLEILELIGQGGMGFVFKARQPKIERLVALKILPASLAADPAFAERFTREGRMLARLNHPNIVTLHDFGQAGGFFYLLMEYVDGVNLRQAMKVGRFTPAQALAVVPKICEALEFAHNEGILHRDIKPENILLDSKGRVKIADFGIAKLVEAGDSHLRQSGTAESALPAANLTETGKVLGTPQYMAPEQIEHPQDVDQRADIYSLGVVFYEMLTGELPLGRFAPPSEKSSVDPRVDEVVLHTLEKERERRTQTAGEVKTQVEAITHSSAPKDPEPVSGQLALASGTRPRRVKLALAASLGLALVFVVSVTWLIPSLRKPGGPAHPDSAASVISPGEPFTKTVVLTCATNQLVGDSGDVRTVTVWSETPVLPGEILQAKQRLIDGEMANASSSLHVQRTANGTATSSGFTWFFRDTFSQDEAQAAVDQLRQNMSGRPLVLTSGKPLALYSVTNKFGGVMSAYLEFEHVPPDPPIRPVKSGPKARASVRLRPSGTMVYYFAKVPPGYALQATANWSEVDDGQASTMSPAVPYAYNSSWYLPGSRFPYGDQQAIATQVERLAEQGPIEVVFGEPRLLFSVTNKLHEVFQGMLELVGPPAATGRSPIQPAAPARSNGLRPALAEAKPQSLNLSAKLAPGQTSTTEPFTKSVVLTGATNELINAATDLRVARMHTDSTLLPGEMLVAMTTLPDGRTVDSSTTFFIQRRGNSVRTSCYFSWGLADSFSPEDFDSAVTQIRQKTTGRPIELAQGSPVELFAVSNKVGGIVRGLLRYERLVAETASGTPGADTNAQATVRLRPYGGGLLAFYSASVPRGYFLEATDNSSELGEGEASTSVHNAPGGWSSSWFPPRSFTHEQSREAVAQLERLAGEGPLQVLHGQPRQVFSITNKAGEVYRGFFELVGPPAPVRNGPDFVRAVPAREELMAVQAPMYLYFRDTNRAAVLESAKRWLVLAQEFNQWVAGSDVEISTNAVHAMGVVLAAAQSNTWVEATQAFDHFDDTYSAPEGYRMLLDADRQEAARASAQSGTNAPPVEPLFNRYVEMKPAEGAYIDFDTGREHRLPAGLDAADPKAMQAWIEKTGVDVRACVVTGWGVLTNLGLTVVELPEITYYTLSESLAALRGARAFPCEARLGPPPGTNWGDIPSTSSKHYAFRTREGAIGWLYVTRSQLKAPPIRYRVLERIAAEEAARLREPRSDASATFGPILERSVVIGTAGPVDGLDLASGKHVAAPPELSRDSAALSAWMGGDIIAVMAGESVGLKGLNIRLIPVASEAWDDLPATAVAELASSGPLWSSRLARTGSYWPKNYPTPLGHRPLSPEEARQYMWPDTFLFRNRIGAAGILQVVGSSSRPPGVTIRYKLAQDGKAR